MAHKIGYFKLAKYLARIKTMDKRKIKAIAFDLVGVLLKENDYLLSPQEQILEKQFGNINFDHK